MKNETLNLEREVSRLTSEFSNSLVLSMTTLNSGHLTDDAITFVEKSKILAEEYKQTLEKLLLALKEEPLADEREHRIEFATRMKSLLEHEMKILLRHPILNAK